MSCIVFSVICVILTLNCISSSHMVPSEHTHNLLRKGRGFDTSEMLNTITGHLMGRGILPATDGASQVVSLNITNLVVLILLKALIFAAGSLGAGYWKGGYGRSIENEDNKFLTNGELLLFTRFLTGSTENNGCLQNIACKQPHFARKYAEAGDVLLKTARSLNFGTEKTYDILIQDLQEASSWGSSGRNCNKYFCNS